MPIDGDGYFISSFTTTTWLHAVGIRHIRQVADVGVIAVCMQVKAHGFPVSLNFAYGLKADLMGISWLHLPKDIKVDLCRAFRDSLSTHGGGETRPRKPQRRKRRSASP